MGTGAGRGPFTRWSDVPLGVTVIEEPAPGVGANNLPPKPDKPHPDRLSRGEATFRL